MTRSVWVAGCLAILLGGDALAQVAPAAPPAEPRRVHIDVGAGDPVLGPSGAPVTLVVFADFECPFCRRLGGTLTRLREKYGDQVRIVWKDYPLTRIHPHAFAAAVAGRCAFEQGRFWEYHHRLFASQVALQTSALQQYAADSALDLRRFAACSASDATSQTVQAAVGVAVQLGLTATPTTFVNGRMVKGAKPYATFASLIDDELQTRPRPTR